MMLPDSDADTVAQNASGGQGKEGEGKKEETLSLDDCRCPVCLEMFLEPVTLPCEHTFCKVCFLESVDKSTLCCPMCRKRVSTWARLNNRNKTLVNEQLWTQIRNSFPQHCQRRLSGQDVINNDLAVFVPRVSEPGELRQEYQDQMSKLWEEKRKLDEEERRASEEFIQRLLAEEEEKEKRIRLQDEILARVLSSELNSKPISHKKPAVVTPARKKVNVGQIEKFLYRLPSKSSPSDCSPAITLISNRDGQRYENILLSREPSPPHADISELQRDRAESPSPCPASFAEEPRHSQSIYADEGTSKRKYPEHEEQDDDSLTEQGRRFSSSSSASTSSSVALYSEWEAQLASRRQQEEADRKMALLLQKEINQEEKQKNTDRRKGSVDAYLLRRDSQRRTSWTNKTSDESTSSSSSSSSLEASTSTHQN
ncbi:E3 ubiquitin-protein ligase rnf168-like [Corythoichthys intestinalis]|uniref:E3 ubiquitin-protein ligase rnf168-like n=1 Tax=Corythoichthys intestinalis TaxID=161448 RepID=UPI0025A55405|nr:E3 ubiquitin-protein ligase rnf168-like [Corythoichthys intestinalis]XP_057684789.1 E3 ubiquitin-protein ligase rnf168-like [Corythoichthys intestinalis]XP_061796973.1 E3 ubiquitin-protein ligase rnf168-like [Nerophis lumbriciformis]